MKRLDFKHSSFLSKEAAPLNFGNFVRSPVNRVNIGNIIKDDLSNVRKLTDTELAQVIRNEADKSGSGAMTFDVAHGATKILPNKWGVYDWIGDKIYKSKQFLERLDTKLGTPLMGKNPDSLRGKIFSTALDPVAEAVVTHPVTGQEIGIGAIGARRASVLAPVTNTIGIATPLLASAYVGEKLLGPNQTPGQVAAANVQPVVEEVVPGAKQLMHPERTAFLRQQTLEKLAQRGYTKFNKSDIMEESVWSSFEKQASLNKIAHLESELEKMAAFAEGLRSENELLTKIATEERVAREQTEQTLQYTKRTLFEKQAESEEFRLRTVARERSKHVVKLAESMLEKGMIKQAQFDEQVDRLMSCDETTLNLYANMVKQANSQDEGLESLAYLREYNSMDSKGSPDRPTKGINKAGQTMGEAARNLLDKHFS